MPIPHQQEIAGVFVFGEDAPLTGNTEYVTELVKVWQWRFKTAMILPFSSGGGADDCSVDVEITYQEVEDSIGPLPVETARNGVAPENIYFPFTIDGDVIQFMRVRVTTGTTPPDKIIVLLGRGRKAT